MARNNGSNGLAAVLARQQEAATRAAEARAAKGGPAVPPELAEIPAPRIILHDGTEIKMVPGVTSNGTWGWDACGPDGKKLFGGVVTAKDGTRYGIGRIYLPHTGDPDKVAAGAAKRFGK